MNTPAGGVNVTAEMVRDMRERTGAGMAEVRHAIALCDGDLLLAEGYLKFAGCAVSVRDEPGDQPGDGYRRWVWSRARAFAAALAPQRSENDNG